MDVHFGVVKKYFPEKGFGFVTHPLDSRMRKDVFFHIRNVQKFNKDIAEKLSSYEPSDDVYFYYEAENTSKGEQVKSIFPANVFGELLKSNAYIFTQKLESIWQDFETLQPIWLCEVTQDLIGVDGLNKLKNEREYLKEKKKEADELNLKEKERAEAEKLKQLELERQEREKIEAERKTQRELQEQQRKIEEEKQQRQRKIEDEEFELLVVEMEPKGFTKSAQVSNYIIRHRLGDKYKHISGILMMENDGSSWNFNGGFPPKIYGMLCQRLGLGNEGTNSRVVGFTPFKDL